ncbi:MAG TPA: HAMP domain-containing histidine kinase [Clostridiales bacterium]|nr:HAMP domain-containing histidine kinase [Clostridiales bacterium]
MAIKRITRRWLFNSFGVIVVIILVIEIAAAIGIANYYYNSVRQTLLSRADSANIVFTRYAEDKTQDFQTQVRDYVISFPAKDKMEMMVLAEDGKILYTSSGFEPDDKTTLDDFRQALVSPDRSGYYVGQMGEERVMAVTMVLSLPGSNISAVRFLVSLAYVDRQIAWIISGLVVLGCVILLLVLFSSSYFINSIVNPVGEVGETARRIAQGDFRARLTKKNDDEIGELCDIINYMAEELGAAETMKNDFISSVSHELRTPLTAIQGWGETILSDGGEDKETLQKGMKVILSETERLSSMVEELLDFSRMQSGRLKLIMSRMDPVAELSEAVMMYTERAKRDGIDLIYEEGDIYAPIRGDKNKIRQVFVNVIDNAIKYSDPGGTVTVKAEIVQNKLVITVSDTGIGIKADDLGKVKTKFYKANSTRRGSGIGLAVADEIVTRHNGTLDIQSQYGKGTTVTITLPIMKKQDELAEINDAAEGTS